MLCPPATSRALADRWSNAELRLVEGAGHSLSEPGVGEAVLQAIEDMKQRR